MGYWGPDYFPKDTDIIALFVSRPRMVSILLEALRSGGTLRPRPGTVGVDRPLDRKA